MKTLKLLLFILTMCLFDFIRAQAPKSCSYQAVITNQDGTAYGNRNVNMRFSILKFGNSIYAESFNGITTSSNGQISINIGQGNRLNGNFAAIDWGNGPFNLMTEIQYEGNPSFEIFSNTEFKSVPYALHAETAKNGMQNLSFDPNQSVLSINNGQFNANLSSLKSSNYSAGSGIEINNNVISAKDNSPNNEIQTLGLNGNTLTLSPNGGSVSLPSGSSLWQQTGANIFYNNGKVGIGTTNPSLYQLYVQAPISAPNAIGMTGNLLIENKNVSIPSELLITASSLQSKGNGSPFRLKLNSSGGGIDVGNVGTSITGYPQTSGANPAYINLNLEGGLSLISGVGANYYGGFYKTSTGGVFEMNSKAIQFIASDNTTGSNRLNISNNITKTNKDIQLVGGSGSENPSITVSNIGKKLCDMQLQGSGGGAFRAYNQDGNEALYMGMTSRNGVYTIPQIIGYNKFNGSTRNVAFQLKADDNGGVLEMFDETGSTPKGGLRVSAGGNLEIWGGSKFFIMERKSNKKEVIAYTSLEGPEAGAYDRGTAKLVNGELYIKYSEVFSEVINPKTVTISLTPLYSETYGLSIVEKTNEGFRVKELMNGTGNFSFDWEVKAVRKGYEDYQVIRPATDYFGEPKSAKQ